MVHTWHASDHAFRALLAVGFVVGCLWFLRPTTSELEKRTLTTFPEFSWASLADGSFTSQVGLWYSDTFPFRDQLMAANRVLKAGYGIQTSTQMVGEQVQADDIPEEGSEPEEPTAREVATLPDNYTADDIQADIQGQVMQGLYVKDGAAYSAYGFSQDNAEAYAAAINGAQEKLGDDHEVFSILIPNNSGALLSDDELAAMGGSDQGQAISYIYSLMDPRVKAVATYDTLREHNDEYIYFRTDHHWTALGAYYVYRNWCDSKGVTPHELDQFEELDLPGFLGSFYSELQLDSMKANPDTVEAYIPMGTNDMVFTDTDGKDWDWHVIQDIRDWASSSYYLTFIGGDRPWSHIHNPQMDDGSSCVVVKESYGNCFVPWLVDHYEDVYVIDFRYATVDVVDYMQENDIQDLIVINNITIATGGSVPAKIASIL